MDTAQVNVLRTQIQYPGMPAPESNVTRAWIHKDGWRYDRLEFNVRVGAGQELQPGISGPTADQVAMNTRKRIDIVAHVGDQVDLIEVKTRMTLGALGQLIGYRHLWQADFPNIAIRQVIALAQIVDQDIRRVLEANSVTVVQAEPEVI